MGKYVSDIDGLPASRLTKIVGVIALGIILVAVVYIIDYGTAPLASPQPSSEGAVERIDQQQQPNNQQPTHVETNINASF